MDGITIVAKPRIVAKLGVRVKVQPACGAKRISKRWTLIRRQATFKLAVEWADEIAANS